MTKVFYYKDQKGSVSKGQTPQTSEGLTEITEAEYKETKMIQEIERLSKRTWQEKRREGYGPIGDQLDMMWHDGVNGTKVWQSHIGKVKNDIPKN